MTLRRNITEAELVEALCSTGGLWEDSMENGFIARKDKSALAGKASGIRLRSGSAQDAGRDCRRQNGR
jgi:hypothetical protein